MHIFHFLACPCFRFGKFSRCRIDLRGVLHLFSIKFVILIAEFVCASMICFAVGDCCNSVSVGCKIVKFCGRIVRTLRHGVLLIHLMQTVLQGSTFN